MTLHFLVDGPVGAEVGQVVALTGAEAKHAAVRRLRVGETVTIGDGAGLWIEGEVADVSAQRVDVRVTAREQRDAPASRLILIQALAKGGRDELAVQAACELGVDEVVPWQAERSVSRWEGAKASRGRERWGTIAREASKQAHRPWTPRVHEPHSTEQLIARAGTERLLVLDPHATVRLSEVVPDGRDLAIVVGPEGGISPAERGSFAAAGIESVRLGESVLRTSTAGPAAIAVLSVKLGRW